MKIDASVNNIPSSYDESNGSLMGINMPAASRMIILNQTNGYIAFSIGDYDEAPSSDLTVNRNQGFCANQGIVALDEVTISNKSRLYIRSDNGIAKKGIIRAFIWSRR